MSKTGVAFSGGGIRSAALCSGVLRRLLQRGVEPDYLSCVSGGGYTGTAYLDWKYRNKQDDPRWHKKFFEHMRSRASMLCDWQKPLHGILDTLIFLVLILFVSVITPFVIWGSYACPLAFVIDFLFGNILRADKFLCTDKQNSTAAVGESCAIQVGTGAFNRILLFTVPLALFFVFYICAKVSPIFSGMAHLLSTISGLLFAFTFGPWFIRDFLDKTPPIVQLAVIIISIVMWFFAPVLRRKASFVLIVYTFAYVVYWHVYKGVSGVKYTEERFYLLLLISGLVMCFVPMLGAFQARLVHIYYRWRLQKAFYTEESVGACGCTGITFGDFFLGTHFSMPEKDHHQRLSYDQVGSLSLADLQDVKPQYISNIVVNEWRDDPHDERKYDLLTMSPTEIERIDRQPGAEELSGKLAPEDVKLSDAMATSAAAVSHHMGAYADSAESFKHILTILGLGMGASMVSDVAYEKREGCLLKFLPYFIEVVRVLPLVLLPVAYFFGAGGSMFVSIGVFIFFFFLVLLTAASVVSTGNEHPRRLEKVTRWLLVHVPFCRYMRDLLGVINTGPVPPAILRLSDGGHIENLAILPLFRRRLQRIVVVNGGYTVPDSSYGDDLVHALQLAREKLNCYFLSLDGRDVIQDIKDKFVKRAHGEQPRSYKFRVDYYERGPGGDRKVGEGEVILIAPRHPDKGVQTTERMTWKEALRDIDMDLEAKMWGPGPDLEAAEVDSLTFCCCECCHDKPFCGISKLVCGVFPQHVTANQFFTPTMFSAYHREGYRACVETNAAEFLGAMPAVDRINIV